jgi:predicted O-linked N-acetylglucosamine transferase (SPINDLY family)
MVKRESTEIIHRTVVLKARKLLRDGEPFRALKLLETLIRLGDHDAEIAAINIYFDVGRGDKADMMLQRIEGEDRSLAYKLVCVKSLANKGLFDKAILFAEEIRSTEPFNREVLDTYFRVLDSSFQPEKGAQVCEELLGFGMASDAFIIRWLALFVWGQGNKARALSLYKKSIECDSTDPFTFLFIGKLFKELKDVMNACIAWQMGLRIANKNAWLNYLLGYEAEDLGENLSALKHFKVAWGSYPCFETLNAAFFSVPLNFSYSAKELRLARKRFMRGVSKALELDSSNFILSAGFSWRMNSWSLAYQQGNMRKIMEGYSKILVRSMLATVPEIKSFQAFHVDESKLEGKTRVALISDFFYGHSNQRVFEGLARYLDKDKFCLILVHGPGSVADDTRGRMDSYADSVVFLTHSIKESANILASYRPDIAFYTDLGMSGWIHAFASIRHAKIQMTTWGVPYTSGLDSVDYYISSQLAESRSAQSHYTEKLHLLSTLPACYPSENIPIPSHDRSYFFLPDEKFVFGALQNVAKYHPDFDSILEAVAQAAPDSLFVFSEHAPNNVISMKLLDRWSKTAPSMIERIHFVATMPRNEFVSLCDCIDLLLDPPYFGSGVSFYESIATGTPTVTLKGKYLRTRFVSAAYKLMGIRHPPVARTPDEYVRLCIDLYDNRDRLKLLKDEIKASSPILFDDKVMVGEIEALFVEALNEKNN